MQRRASALRCTSLGYAKVFVSYIEPVCYFVCCHIVVLYILWMQNYEIILKVTIIIPHF